MNNVVLDDVGDDVIEISDPSLLPSEPVVSVLMLAYNHERFLRDAIEGVLLQQVDFPIELVIAEDCSSDGTRAIAEEYQRLHPGLVRIVMSSANVGMLANHRRALSACKGEFIAYCEGDDYWHHPHKLAMQVATMQASPEVGLIHTEYDYRVGDRVGQRMMQANARAAPEGDALETLLAGYWLGTATLMYRRLALEQFEASGISEEAYRFADYSRALFVALHWKLAYLPVSTATYRYMHGSAMNSGAISTLRLRESVVSCRKDFMKLTGRVPTDLATIERAEQRLLYANAYLARDADVFEASSTWLRANDAGWQGGWRHDVRRILMEIAPLHRLVLLRARFQWWRGVVRRYVPMSIPEQRQAATEAKDDR